MASPPNFLGNFQNCSRSSENGDMKQTHLTFALVKQVTIAMDGSAADPFEDLENNREESFCDDNSNRLKSKGATPPFSSDKSKRPGLDFGLSKERRSKVKRSQEDKPLTKLNVSPSKKKTRFTKRASSSGPPSRPVDQLPGICTANKILYYLLSTLRENGDTDNHAEFPERNEKSEFGDSQCSEDGSAVHRVTEYSNKMVPKTSNGGSFVVVEGNHKRYKPVAQIREAEADVFDPAYIDQVYEKRFNRRCEISEYLKLKHLSRRDKRAGTKRNTNCSKEKPNTFAFNDDEIFELIHSEAHREAICTNNVETESEDEETQYITPGNTLNRILKMISQQHENVQVTDLEDVNNEEEDVTLRHITPQRSRFRRTTQSVDGRSDSKRNERTFKVRNSPDSITRQPRSKNIGYSDSDNTAKTCINKLNRELSDSESEDNDGLRAKKLDMLGTMIDTMCRLNGEEFLLMDVTSQPEQSRDRTNMASYPEPSRDPSNVTSHPELKRDRTSARKHQISHDTPHIRVSKKRSNNFTPCRGGME